MYEQASGTERAPAIAIDQITLTDEGSSSRRLDASRSSASSSVGLGSSQGLMHLVRVRMRKMLRLSGAEKSGSAKRM